MLMHAQMTHPVSELGFALRLLQYRLHLRRLHNVPFDLELPVSDG